MNRSNVGRQMVGDLSRLVGRNVGDQFSNKNQAYADGDVVTLGPDLAEVSYTDVFGKVKKYQYNPNTHDKPQPSGRMRKLSTNLGGTADYKNAALLPGQRFFDYLTPVSVEAETVSAPVSIAPPKKEISEGSGGNEREEFQESPITLGSKSIDDAISNAKTVGTILGFLPGGSILGPLVTEMGLKGVLGDVQDTIGSESLGFDDEGGVADSGAGKGDKQDATVAGLLATGQLSRFDKDKEEGTTEGQIRDQAKAAQALSNLYSAGLSIDDEGNVTRGGDKLDDITLDNLASDLGVGAGQLGLVDVVDNTSMSLFGGPSPDFGGDAGFEAPDLSNLGKQNLDEYLAPEDTGSDGDDTFSLSSEDLEDMGNMDDFYGFGAGGITSLYGGGPAEAPADRPLDAGSFVVSADVVSGVGDGSTESGIERLSGLLGIPLDGSMDGPNGTMAGRVTTADGGPVPGTGLSDSVNTVITGASGGSVNTYARGLSVNNPLQQATRSGTTAAKIARDEIVIPTTALAKLPVMFGGDKRPNLAKGQQMMTNFMENVRARKTNTGGEQPGPLVPEGESVVKGLSSLMFKRPK
tara:strand:+ start:5105 stop:6841 length:1737 start_codon:yes stop_codon:yes gene_type:complete